MTRKDGAPVTIHVPFEQIRMFYGSDTFAGSWVVFSKDDVLTVLETEEQIIKQISQEDKSGI